MKRWIAVTALCGALLVAGCSSDGGDSADAGPPSASPATGTSSSATPRSTFKAKPDCGRVNAKQGQRSIPEYGCLLAAVDAGITAKLVVLRPTTEGDPIRYTYTVQPGGSVEIERDTRGDKFGTSAVTLQVCPARGVLRDDPSTSGCSPEIPASAKADPKQTGSDGSTS